MSGRELEKASRDTSHAQVDVAVRGADEWARLWFTLVRYPWRSLALVPADPSISSLTAAHALSEAGRPYQRDPVYVVDAERVAPTVVIGVLGSLSTDEAGETKTLIAVRSPLLHQPAIPIVRTADAAVLLVRLGTSDIRQARRTLESIGGGHFIGSVSVLP
jgi:hypothetical protein